MPDVVYAYYNYGLVVMRNSTPRAGAHAPDAPTLNTATPGKTNVTLCVDAARLQRRLGDRAASISAKANKACASELP